MRRHVIGHRGFAALAAIVAAAACGDDGGSGGSGGSGTTTGGPGTTKGATTGSASSVTTGGSTSSASSSASTGGEGGMASGGGGSGGATSSATTDASSSASTGMGGGDPNDQDGDGWTIQDGDCCDVGGTPICTQPEKVNPGAFEYLGNGVDDDCDATTSDTVAPAECTPLPLQTPTTSLALAKAMDLCQFTSESPPLPQKKWGVVATDLTLADVTSAPPNVQVGVLGSFGQYVTPKKGTTMASLSSGTARAEGDPGDVHPQDGPMNGQDGTYNGNTQVGVPADYLAANGGTVPNPASCPACNNANCTQAFDSVRFRMRIRVPTNAQSFSYALKFYTSEYPEYSCQTYNDFFVALLDSSWVPDPMANPPQDPLPADKNIAIDGLGNAVSVNNAFLDVCFPAMGAPPGSCPSGTLELIGTGMGGWNGAVTDGGGTVWLINEAPVVPGETIELEFITWDAGDHNVDSLVLLDRFRWQIDPASVGLHE